MKDWKRKKGDPILYIDIINGDVDEKETKSTKSN